ncbi:MAG: hypothetical protein ABSH26_16600 [Opitutaceae bacterium]
MTPTGHPEERAPLLATKGDWVALGMSVLVVISFYYWTAATSDGLPPWPMGRGSYSDFYNLLVHGILKGHLYLDAPVDPAMLTASNPYDPRVWVPHGWMFDASFYHGKYYVYYGVVPALVFLLPFRLLTGGDLWLGTAVECLVVLDFLALAWLWLRIRRDYFSRTGSAIVFATVMALGMATGLLSLARRPLMYEFAIACGCFFATLMLHSLYSALSSQRQAGWMAAAGIFLGLAVGCRPTLLLAILAPAWVLWSFLRLERPPIRSWRHPGAPVGAATGFAVGFGAIFSGLLLYNYLRFGSPLDFGFNYLLQDPPAPLRHWGTSYFWFNLRVYYAGALEWSRHFPFASIGVHPAWPRDYYGCADVYGILKYVPIAWFLLAIPVALRAPSGSGPRHIGAVLGMVGLAYLGPGLCVLLFGNSALRYTVDFLPSLVLVSTLGACALDQAVSSPWAKNAVRAAWAAAAAVSVAVAAILSIPLEGTLTVHRGSAYFEKVARILNVPTFWYEVARDWHYGPITWQMAFPAKPPHTVETLAETPNASLLLEYLPDSRIRLGLKCAGDDFVLWGEGAGVARGRASTLSASFGSLYPTAEHPYYLRRAPSAISRSSVYVVLDDHPVLEALRPLNPVDCKDIHVANGRNRPGWFSGSVLAVARDMFPIRDITPDFAPRTIRLAVPSQPRPGRWPLVSAGSPDGGDLLFMETAGGETARFGYFSTGSSLRYGPPFRLAPGSSLECAVQMEQMDPSGRMPGPLRPLLIEKDGRINWMDYVPYHPCAPGAVLTGENAVAGPSIEKTFPGEIRWVGTPPRLLPAEPTDHLLLRVVFPTQPRWGLREPLLLTGVPGACDGICVVHYGGGLGRFLLDHWGVLNQEGPIVGSVESDTLHDIEIITPVFSLYRGSRQPARGTILVRMDGKEVLRVDSDLYPARLEEAVVGRNDKGGPTEKQFLGALLSQRWIGAPDR